MGGFMGFKSSVLNASECEEEASPNPVVTPVETALVESQDGRDHLRTGHPKAPSQALNLQSQVVGPIKMLNANLSAGGRIKRRGGEVLFKADDRDYRLTVAHESLFKKLTSQGTQLKQEQGRQAVAKKEWALMGSSVKSSRSCSLPYESPKEGCPSAIQSAQSAVSIAELSLERTVKGTFDAVVQVGNTGSGSTGRALDKGSRNWSAPTWWAEISLPMDQLNRIEIPGAVLVIKQDPKGPGRVGRALWSTAQNRPSSQMAKPLSRCRTPVHNRMDRFSMRGVEIGKT